MASLRSTVTALATVTLSAAALGHLANALAFPSSALAEEALEAPVFPIPDQLPANATLTLDGSSSMVLVNQGFQRQMLKRFPNLTIQQNTSDAHTALENLRRGEVDVVALGRRLTEEERAQGLVEVPISREKIALIVGPQNPFSGGLTLDHLAPIFYGEISNWAALGGPDLPLRFVDRPASSDTRQSLGQYPGFAEKGLTPGPTVSPVAEDSTDAVIAALGNDGIGYAVVSQVQGRGDVRLLSVDGVPPTNGAYPYSQSRVYVYNGNNPSPSALAFLGVVNTPANLTPPSAVAVATAAPEDSVAETPTRATPAAIDPTIAAPVEAEFNGLDPATAPNSVPGGAAQPRPWTDRGQAWGWLIAIPLLGGLLWWLLQRQAQQTTTVAVAPEEAEPTGRLVLTPRHCRRAYAYWEVPDELRAKQRERGGRTLTLRLLDVTDRDVEHHPPHRIDQFPVTEEQRDLHIPIPADDRSYLAELGYVTQENHWLPLAKSAAVHVPACAVAPAPPAVAVSA